jgi:hypothetical protein
MLRGRGSAAGTPAMRNSVDIDYAHSHAIVREIGERLHTIYFMSTMSLGPMRS